MRIIQRILFVSFSAALLLSVRPSLADSVQTTLPGDYGPEAGPGGLVANFYQWALGISGVLAFGAIVWGGVVYTFARGNPAGQSEGKKWITGALLGLALLGGAYLLLRTISPEIVSLKIEGVEGLE